MKIYLIEDEYDLAVNIVEFLTLENHVVKHNATGENYIEEIGTFAPDLIICDIMLPYKSGLEIVEDLFKREALDPQTIIIMLTAKSDRESIRTAMVNGVDDYITKPFSYKELMDSIITQLKKRDRIYQRDPATGEPRNSSETNRLVVFLDNKREIRTVRVNDILMIKVNAGFSRVYISSGDFYYSFRNLKKWAEILNYSNFVTVRRGLMINQNYMLSMTQNADYRLELTMANYEKPIFASQRLSRILRKKYR